MVYHIEYAHFRDIPEGLYLDMINDQTRLDASIKPAIKDLCKDRVVIDLGCGSGVLGLYALEHGAKFVYFVEQNPNMVKILKDVLPTLIDNSKFEIIHSYCQNLRKEHFKRGTPELCVSELIGTQLFDEGYYQCTAPLKRMFKDLIFVPDTFHLDIYQCDVDYNSPIWPQHEKHLVEHYKNMYSRIGWTHWFVGMDKEIDFLNPVKIGEIIYDANQGKFNNRVTKVIQPKEGVMINIRSFVYSNGIKEYGPLFGWYVYPYNKNLQVDIVAGNTVDNANVNLITKTQKKLK